MREQVQGCPAPSETDWLDAAMLRFVPDDTTAQKGSVPELEREAFRSEMQKKMQDLTPQERQNLKQQKKIMNKGSSYCSGGGNGNMYKGSKGNRY